MVTAPITIPRFSQVSSGTSHKFERAEVQVWETWLDQPAPEVRRLCELLSPDEKLRAGRFYFPKDREHYIVGRGTLRSILGCCLGVEPRALCFQYNSYGKPSLTDEFGGAAIRFNLSHSHGRAVFAVTQDCEVGIDVELIRTDFASMEIADKFFSPREVAQLRGLPVGLRAQAFFNCWTRKEAYVKARGEGLSFPLEKFDVSLVPGAPAALLYTEGEPDEVRRWALEDLRLDAGYVGALAVRFASKPWNAITRPA